MKQFIFNQLEEIEFAPLEKNYQTYINKFNTEKQALDALEFRIQEFLRHTEFNKVHRANRVNLRLAVNKALIPRMEKYCNEMNINKNEFLQSVMKWTRRQ